MDDLSVAEKPEAVIHSQKQLAQAALMYHVIAVDGVIRDEERERLIEVLSSEFEIDEDEAMQLAEEGRDAEHEAIDLYQFTSILKRAFEREECIAIIENLWEMVFADGIVHEMEDNVVWRVAELLGVDTRERMLVKQRVWKRTNNQESANHE
ncbi:MAG: TerB family tellurite resistance protein [Rhizobiaceae bacterium]|nr:TerB family tellurite resistance protein [Rhizobiaceae bacterium]